MFFTISYLSVFFVTDGQYIFLLISNHFICTNDVIIVLNSAEWK